MTYRSGRYRHDCARHGCQIEASPSWDDILECFAGRVYPTDIDGMVERGGRFLFLEEKGAGVPLPTGQRLALQRLAELGDGLVTVKIFRPAGSGRLDVLTYPAGERFVAMSREEFLAELWLWDVGAGR